MISYIAQTLFSVSVWFFRMSSFYFPSRVFDIIGKKAYPKAEYEWHTNSYGARLSLSPHFHIDRNIIMFGCYDRELHIMIEKRYSAGMVCFDIGSNLGEVALHLARNVGKTGKVFAIDPNPFAFRRLIGHVEENGFQSIVECLPIAVSNIVGELELSFPDEGADNQGLGSVVNTRQRGVSRTQTVKTLTLDEIVAQYSLQRVDVLKIDTQGSEPLILDGASRMLKKFSPDIIMEISPRDLSQIGMSSADLLAKIESFGYSVFEFSKGKIIKQISSESILPEYEAENVICTKKVSI